MKTVTFNCDICGKEAKRLSGVYKDEEMRFGPTNELSQVELCYECNQAMCEYISDKKSNQPK